MFTEEYILFCWKNRHLFPNKKAKVGDWYLNTEFQTLSVLSKTDIFDSAPDSLVYIPDLDDLLELLNNQIIFTGENPDDSQIKINQEDGKCQWKSISPRQIAEKVSKSVVLIVTQDADGELKN